MSVTAVVRIKAKYAAACKGSETSGNWGHAGRPGQVGGSGPGGPAVIVPGSRYAVLKPGMGAEDIYDGSSPEVQELARNIGLIATSDETFEYARQLLSDNQDAIKTIIRKAVYLPERPIEVATIENIDFKAHDYDAMRAKAEAAFTNMIREHPLHESDTNKNWWYQNVPKENWHMIDEMWQERQDQINTWSAEEMWDRTHDINPDARQLIESMQLVSGKQRKLFNNSPDYQAVYNVLTTSVGSRVAARPSMHIPEHIDRLTSSQRAALSDFAATASIYKYLNNIKTPGLLYRIAKKLGGTGQSPIQGRPVLGKVPNMPFSEIPKGSFDLKQFVTGYLAKYSIFPEKGTLGGVTLPEFAETKKMKGLGIKPSAQAALHNLLSDVRQQAMDSILKTRDFHEHPSSRNVRIAELFGITPSRVVQNVFRVVAAKYGNIKDNLFHGTGFFAAQRIAAKGYQSHDASLGPGVYLAPQSSKSMQYTGGGIRTRMRSVLLNNVAALGRMWTYSEGATGNFDMTNPHWNSIYTGRKQMYRNPEYVVKDASAVIAKIWADLHHGEYS